MIPELKLSDSQVIVIVAKLVIFTHIGHASHMFSMWCRPWCVKLVTCWVEVDHWIGLPYIYIYIYTFCVSSLLRLEHLCIGVESCWTFEVECGCKVNRFGFGISGDNTAGRVALHQCPKMAVSGVCCCCGCVLTCGTGIEASDLPENPAGEWSEDFVWVEK